MGGGGGGEYNRHWIFLFGEEKKNEVIIRSRYRSQPQFLSEFNSVQLGLPPVNFQITPIFTSRTVSQSRRVTHTQSHTRHRITSPPYTNLNMSPIAARTAFRYAATAGRRQFSVIHSLRSFARSFEPHPFERLPVANNAQAADWGRQAKRLMAQGAM